MANPKQQQKSRWMGVASVLVPLICGTGGAWGITQYFVERPLRQKAEAMAISLQEKDAALKEAETALKKTEAALKAAETATQELEARLKEARLDVEEQEMTIKNFQERVAALDRGIGVAKAAGRNEAVELLSSRLQQTLLAMDRRLGDLQRELESKRASGQGWFAGVQCPGADMRRPINDVRQIRDQVQAVTRDTLTISPAKN